MSARVLRCLLRNNQERRNPEQRFAEQYPGEVRIGPVAVVELNGSQWAEAEAYDPKDRERWKYQGVESIAAQDGTILSTFYLWERVDADRGNDQPYRYAWQIDHYRKATTGRKAP